MKVNKALLGLTSVGLMIMCTACAPRVKTQVDEIGNVDVYVSSAYPKAREITVRTIDRKYAGVRATMYVPECVDIDTVKEGTVHQLPLIRTTATVARITQTVYELDYSTSIICKEFGRR